MFYVPTELNNPNYSYFINNNDNILIFHDNIPTICLKDHYQCYTTDVYLQPTIQNLPQVPYENITSSWLYRNDLGDILLCTSLIIFPIILLIYYLLKRILGGWI